MFFLRVLDLAALVSLFVQAFTAWVFVALFASVRRWEREAVAFRDFLVSFLALSAGLTILGGRFAMAYDVELGSTLWIDGTRPVIACYMAYCGSKALFASFLLRGFLHVIGKPLPRGFRAAELAVLVLATLVPLTVHGIHSLLLLQAPLMIGTALFGHRILGTSRDRSSGLRLLRLSLLAIAGTWTLHATSILNVDRAPVFRYLLALNSLMDLAVQLVLGIGVVLLVLQEAARRLRAAEQERERLQRVLDRDEKLRALGTLVSGVAHELNNPLTVILGTCDLLSIDARPADRDALQLVVEQAERCCGIVRDLSSIARRSERPREMLELGELVERVSRALSPASLREGQRLTVDTGPDLRFAGDRTGLEQVLINLVSNALQASPPGGEVLLSASVREEELEFRVVDQGPGVPTELRDRLFEPFFTTKEPGAGTGLGLAIAHEIVRAHGGRISVEDSPTGRGAMFRVVLPIERNGPSPVRSSGGGRAGRLLVVDDEPAVRTVLAQQAQRRGWSVTEASSVEEALEQGDLEHQDAILCDLRMPGIAGEGFHDHLAEADPAALSRTVFITGDLASPNAVSFAQRCRRPIVQKPLDFDELFSVLVLSCSPERSASSD